MDTTASIVASLLELNRIMRNRSARGDVPGEVNMYQMHVLLLIQEHPGIAMGELAKLLHVSQASATPLVAKLVRLGFLRRSVDRKNRKMIRVRLAPKGGTMLKQATARCYGRLHSMFSRLSDDDKTVLADILSRFVSTLHSA